MNSVWKTSGAVTLNVASDYISHLALLTLIHLVCLHQVQVLVQINNAALNVSLVTSLRESTVLIGLNNFGMPSESECSSIEHQHLLDTLALEDTVLQIPILLPVQVCLAFWWHVVEHVL